MSELHFEINYEASIKTSWPNIEDGGDDDATVGTMEAMAIVTHGTGTDVAKVKEQDGGLLFLDADGNTIGRMTTRDGS